ncbi:DNA polymerase Y family protein [Naasia sp. SYSU D00057]|uniref:DNA polymerase Y family protein n=1 Tax=Naasia sp. SYSU D00057 TaxID=2817380 RepID=UPI001B30E758|nr:DNA polymerase Y family protein [Naasia sp. SYSU D00057]
MTAAITRTLVFWCPDWPVLAAARAAGLPPDAPIALTDRGDVYACSAAARAEGVRRGLRIREAQSRCASLVALPYDPALDARTFDPVLDGVEEVMPGVQVLRPGTAALRVQGPARYYGGEEAAARELLACLERLGVPSARVGIADGPFAAEQAARRSGEERIRVVPAGDSPAFLAPMPVTILGVPDLAVLLKRLGLPTLGAFAALPELEVRNRFGPEGAVAHRLAAGLDGRRVVPRIPPDELDVVALFEPPLDRIDQVAFGIRDAADRFLERLRKLALVCTAVRVEVTAERGETSERSWLHPRSFTAAEVVDRVRWQLQGTGTVESGLGSPIVRVRILPESVDAASGHEEGLWGQAPDERIHHGLSRVQSMLGHEAVLTATLGGGRMLTDREVLVPWGDRGTVERPADRPWPGALPGLPPATVFRERRTCAVLSPDGTPVRVDDRGTLSGPPSRFAAPGTGHARPIRAWAGPWNVEERWWDPRHARRLSRFQVVDEEGEAWLLVLEGDIWWAEARYD